MERKGGEQKFKEDCEASEEGSEGSRSRLHCSNLIHKDHLTINMSCEASMDIRMLTNLAIICRIIGPKCSRKTIRSWFPRSWSSMEIVKFLPKGFFVVIFKFVKEKDKILKAIIWRMDSHPVHM